MSTGGPCPTYTWSVNPSTGYSFTPSSGTVQAKPKIKFTAIGFYTVTLTAANASGSSTMVDYVDVYDCFNEVGVNETRAIDLNTLLVPNPSADGTFNLLFRSGSVKNINLKVYNNLGQLIYVQNNAALTENTININLSKQPAGIYTLNVDSDGKRSVKRMVISK